MINFLKEYEYCSTGFWRKKGVPKGQKAEILHGDMAIKKAIEMELASFKDAVKIDEKGSPK